MADRLSECVKAASRHHDGIHTGLKLKYEISIWYNVVSKAIQNVIISTTYLPHAPCFCDWVYYHDETLFYVNLRALILIFYLAFCNSVLIS